MIAAKPKPAQQTFALLTTYAHHADADGRPLRTSVSFGSADERRVIVEGVRRSYDIGGQFEVVATGRDEHGVCELPHRPQTPRVMKEKQVQTSITRFLHALGCHVSDLSQPRATLQTPGLPDLYVQHPDLGTFWVEVKSPTGRVRKSQEDWHEREHAAGGLVLVARSAADLIEPLQQLGAPINR